MKRRKNNPQNHQRDGKLLEQVMDPAKFGEVRTGMFQHDRTQLQKEDGQIKHDTHGDFEKDRVELRVDQGMPDMQWYSQVV